MKNRGSPTHIPALDGLRALAVIAVIAFHLFPQAVPGGYIGVDLFFVISGYLITTLLIAEHVRKGKISLKQFWLRRARRLLPALFTTILIISSIMFFVKGDVLVGIGRQILGAATFSSNWLEVAAGTNYFSSTTPHLFLNFWSLGVEEQFYLLWPFIALIIIAGVKKPKIGMILTALFALGSAGWMAYLYLHGASATRVYYGTDTHFFGLMLGAFLAFWARVQAPGYALRRLFAPFGRLARMRVLSYVLGFATVGGWIWLAIRMSDQMDFAYIGGLFLASVLSAILVVVAAGGKTIMTKLFSLRPLEWVGKRSYGIYLWHWPLLVLLKLLFPSSTAFWVYPLILVPATFCIAALSYTFIEEPIRKNGFKATLAKAVHHKHIVLDSATVCVHRWPHIALAPVVAAVVLTIGAVITAPTKTSAQLSVEHGQQALAHQQKIVRPVTSVAPHISSTLPQPVTGNIISAIGDSVMVASTPALQAKFPGILINADISRSMRRGGLETIENMKQAGQLRPIVVVALGTNGYYGDGELDRMISELKGYKLILVTAHADREWTAPNNADIHTEAAHNPDISIAEWDEAISPRPDLLSEDGIHPIAAEGGELYASAIADALKKFE